jgi:hypothetical protein
VSPSQSGAMIKGEARKIHALRKATGGKYLLTAMNNDSMKIFEQNFY